LVAGLQRLRPLNLYGWSKHLFAQMIANRFAKGLPLPPQWVGLKFFNVFGPNEYHKGDMMSLVAKRLDEPGAGGSFGCLHRDAIADGDQRRDFISVEDAGTGEHRIHRYTTNISRQVPVFYQADVKNLRRAGYDKAFTPLEHAMGHYITGFLNRVERYR
jgi:ADP-L-glycero-D-manno-heptose 6-epimerase